MFFPTGRSVWTAYNNIWLLLTPDSVWGSHLMSQTTVDFIGFWLAKQNDLNIDIKYPFMARMYLWGVIALLTLIFLLLTAAYPQKQAILFEENTYHNLKQNNEWVYYLKRIPWVFASILLSLLIYCPLSMFIKETQNIHTMVSSLLHFPECRLPVYLQK
jgi:cytochrome bd-type quinol oxidase subunit 2